MPAQPGDVWSWTNCGRMWSARKTRSGCGSRCVAAPGKAWPGITVRARWRVAANCGKRVRPPTKLASSSPTFGKRIKRLCPTISTDLAPSRKERQTPLRDSTSPYVSASGASLERRFPFPKATSCTSSTSEPFSSNTTETAFTDSTNLTAFDHYPTIKPARKKERQISHIALHSDKASEDLPVTFFLL